MDTTDIVRVPIETAARVASARGVPVREFDRMLRVLVHASDSDLLILLDYVTSERTRLKNAKASKEVAREAARARARGERV